MKFSVTTLIACVVAIGSTAFGQIAWEDFDGGAKNLLASSVPTVDGGGGDTFAVGALVAWPTSGGTPFALADNSVGDVGDTTAFEGDTEGVFGVNADFSNMFLGISDTRDDGENFTGDVTATWTFDVAGYSDLSLSIDLGSMEGSNFGYNDATSLLFSASLDGGATQTAIHVIPDTSGNAFSYRPLDDGVVVTEEAALIATGDNPVIKTFADSGLTTTDTYLDKSVVSGEFAGQLDSFTTALNGTGNQLTLMLTANVPFEAVAIDNIRINGVPEPSASLMSVLGILGVMMARRRGKE